MAKNLEGYQEVLRHLRNWHGSATEAPSPGDPDAPLEPVLPAPTPIVSEFRYGSAPRGPVMHKTLSDSSSSPPDHTRLPGRLPLVGRTEELAALEDLLEAGDRTTSTVIISGEGGVGKSRLASELAGRAKRNGWQLVHGRAYPVETGVPYAMFSEAFLPLLKAMDPDTLTVLSRGGEAELGYLFPALSINRERSSGTGADPEEFRTRLMWNFAEFLRSYAARMPLLLVLEDLQWADESSLHLLHFLARQAQGQPLLIVGTYNDAERDRNPQLIQTERSLVALGVGEVRRIDPLTYDQVTEIICRLFSVDADVVKEFSALLFGWTRGNPFFVEEILKSLVSSGRLRDRKGTWVGWDSNDFSLPGTIRDAVLERLRTFSEDAQTVAELAAVIGARASYPLLASISGLTESVLLSALEELCAHRVLRERAEPAAIVYDFEHPLVQQTLYGEFGLQRARVLHGAVAEAMEAFYGTSAIDHADELASHFVRTDNTSLRGKAVRYLAAAGAQALDRHADREAVNYLRAAVDRSDGSDPEEKTRLVPLLARAHQHVGEYEAAVALWADVLEDLPTDHPRYGSFCRSLGMAHFWCGRHKETHAQLDVGLSAARDQDDQGEIVRLLIAKSHCLSELGLGQEALDTIRPALPIAEALGQPRMLARVHRALALLHVWIGPPDQAREHGRLAIELAKEVGDVSIEFWARWGLAVLDDVAGASNAMAQALDEIGELASKSRSPLLRLWMADMAIGLAYGQGDWDKGLALAEQAIALARNLHQRTLLPRLLVWHSLFYVGRGQLEQAQTLVDEAVSMSGIGDGDGPVDVHQVVPTYIGWAHYLVGLGEYQKAISVAEKGLQIAEGTGYILWAIHRLLPVLGEAYLWAGEIDRAQEVAHRMREHAERLDHKLGFVWADACDALVCWKRGDAKGAVRLMRGAAEALEEIPMIPYAARIRRQLAGRLAEIGDTEAALTELRRVHETFVRLGADLELEKARMQFREMGHRPPPKGLGEGMAGLTSRELEVARLVARRMSNKAIGKELSMATRTASTHLSNIFQKLGVRTRGELADLIREKGLLED